MTVEVEYKRVDEQTFRWQQLDMARQIENNRGFPIEDITRIFQGETLIVRVKTNLPDSAIDNMLSDIEDHLNSEAHHVETREV